MFASFSKGVTKVTDRGEGRRGVRSEQVASTGPCWHFCWACSPSQGLGVFSSLFEENKTTTLKKINPPSCSLDYLQIPKIWRQPKWPLIVAVQQQKVMSNSLLSHGLQHTRLFFPSPSPRACSNSCVLSQWCHPTILSSVIPFSPCFLFFPASAFFLISRFFKGACPYHCFDFRLLFCSTVKVYIYFVSSHPVCGTLLQQPGRII